MPLIYCDAAPLPQGGFSVACYKRDAFATVARYPRWIASQQAAELYAVFNSLRQAALRKFSHVCFIVANAAAFYTVRDGRVSANT